MHKWIFTLFLLNFSFQALCEEVFCHFTVSNQGVVTNSPCPDFHLKDGQISINKARCPSVLTKFQIKNIQLSQILEESCLIGTRNAQSFFVTDQKPKPQFFNL